MIIAWAALSVFSFTWGTYQLDARRPVVALGLFCASIIFASLTIFAWSGPT